MRYSTSTPRCVCCLTSPRGEGRAAWAPFALVGCESPAIAKARPSPFTAARSRVVLDERSLPCRRIAERAGATAEYRPPSSESRHVDYGPLESLKPSPSHLQAAFVAAQAAAPALKRAAAARGGARVVKISSGAGLRPSLTRLHAYCVAKHALVGHASTNVS